MRRNERTHSYYYTTLLQHKLKLQSSVFVDVNATNDNILVAVTDVQNNLIKIHSPMCIKSYRAGQLLGEPVFNIKQN